MKKANQNANKPNKLKPLFVHTNQTSEQTKIRIIYFVLPLFGLFTLFTIKKTIQFNFVTKYSCEYFSKTYHNKVLL